MVRDASAGMGGWPRKVVERSLAKAEATNPPDTVRGRIVRQAGVALLEWVEAGKTATGRQNTGDRRVAVVSWRPAPTPGS